MLSNYNQKLETSGLRHSFSLLQERAPRLFQTISKITHKWCLSCFQTTQKTNTNDLRDSLKLFEE